MDELRNMSTNSQQFLINLEQKERERAKINTLKVGYNRIYGYYIEISRAQAKQAPRIYSAANPKKMWNVRLLAN